MKLYPIALLAIAACGGAPNATDGYTPWEPTTNVHQNVTILGSYTTATDSQDVKMTNASTSVCKVTQVIAQDSSGELNYYVFVEGDGFWHLLGRKGTSAICWANSSWSRLTNESYVQQANATPTGGVADYNTSLPVSSYGCSEMDIYGTLNNNGNRTFTAVWPESDGYWHALASAGNSGNVGGTYLCLGFSSGQPLASTYIVSSTNEIQRIPDANTASCGIAGLNFDCTDQGMSCYVNQSIGQAGMTFSGHTTNCACNIECDYF